MQKEVIPASELLRKLLHLFFGTVFILVIVLFGRAISLYIFAVCFVLGALISSLMLHRLHIPVFSSFIAQVQRNYERSLPGQGALLFFLSTILLLSVFSNEFVAVGALIVSVYGDGFSALIGRSFGRTPLVNKMTLEGSAAGIAVSAILLSFLFPLHIALATALTGMLAELLPIDDNFTIPLVSGAVLSFLL